MRACLATCALPLASLLLAAAAEADPRAAVDLRYRAHAGCPDRAAFIEEIERRTERAHFRSPDEPGPARRFEVVLERSGSTTAGTLRIHEPDGRASTPRAVEGEACASVVGALALIAALAIDPDMGFVPPPVPAPSPEPAPATAPAPAPARPQPVPSPPPRRSAPEPAWRWSIGAQAGATSGFGNKLAAVIPVFVDITRYGDGWVEPSLRLGIALMPERRVVHPVATAALSRVTWPLSGCVVVLRISKELAARPCLGFEAGLLRSIGRGVDESVESITPWVAMQAIARMELRPLDWAVLEARADLGVPLVRPRFVVDPAIEVVRLDPVYGHFSGGLGVRFP